MEAADVNKDGKVTIKDIMLINNSILGKSKLTQ
ncbi:dockerin type I domain-containing protein [Agathobacter rectalis]